jgi:hypothetical protein
MSSITSFSVCDAFSDVLLFLSLIDEDVHIDFYLAICEILPPTWNRLRG